MKISHILILFVMIFYSCSNGGNHNIKHEKLKIEAIIDNPSVEPLTIIVDSIEYLIDSFAMASITLEEGSHNFSFNDTIVNYRIKPEDYKYTSFRKVIINPMASSYIYSQRTYGSNKTVINQADKIPIDSIRVMDVFTITGNYKKTNAFILDGFWDYGLKENFPETIQTQYASSGIHKVKIYREKDFFFSLMSK